MQMPNHFAKKIQYHSASRAEVPTDPPALCPTTGPEVPRTGVPADLEGRGGVVGVPYPNPTDKNKRKLAMPPTTCSRTTQKSAAGKENKKISPGVIEVFKKRLFGSGSPKGAAAVKGGIPQRRIGLPSTHLHPPTHLLQPLSAKKAEKISREITWKDLWV